MGLGGIPYVYIPHKYHARWCPYSVYTWRRRCGPIHNSNTILHPRLYIQIYTTIRNNYIFIIMPSKLKPSTKEYKRDRMGRMTNQWTWKHYTLSGTSTEELLKAHKSLPRKKSMIERELTKRGVNGIA